MFQLRAPYTTLYLFEETGFKPLQYTKNPKKFFVDMPSQPLLLPDHPGIVLSAFYIYKENLLPMRH